MEITSGTSHTPSNPSTAPSPQLDSTPSSGILPSKHLPLSWSKNAALAAHGPIPPSVGADPPFSGTSTVSHNSPRPVSLPLPINSAATADVVSGNGPAGSVGETATPVKTEVSAPTGAAISGIGRPKLYDPILAAAVAAARSSIKTGGVSISVSAFQLGVSDQVPVQQQSLPLALAPPALKGGQSKPSAQATAKPLAKSGPSKTLPTAAQPIPMPATDSRKRDLASTSQGGNILPGRNTASDLATVKPSTRPRSAQSSPHSQAASSLNGGIRPQRQPSPRFDHLRGSSAGDTASKARHSPPLQHTGQRIRVDSRAVRSKPSQGTDYGVKGSSRELKGGRTLVQPRTRYAELSAPEASVYRGAHTSVPSPALLALAYANPLHLNEVRRPDLGDSLRRVSRDPRGRPEIQSMGVIPAVTQQMGGNTSFPSPFASGVRFGFPRQVVQPNGHSMGGGAPQWSNQSAHQPLLQPQQPMVRTISPQESAERQAWQNAQMQPQHRPMARVINSHANFGGPQWQQQQQQQQLQIQQHLRQQQQRQQRQCNQERSGGHQ